MTDAVIVAAARTPIGKAVRGSYADVHPVTLAGHVVAEVVSRGRVEPAHIDDVVSGSAASRGPATGNLARLAALPKAVEMLQERLADTLLKPLEEAIRVGFAHESGGSSDERL